MNPAIWPFFGKSVWCAYPPACTGSKALLPMTKRARLSAVVLALLVAAAGVDTASAKGDVERGRRLARECFACHGSDGYSPSPINPKIGGQHERYLYLALKKYRDGGRTHSLMVEALDDHDTSGKTLAAVDSELSYPWDMFWQRRPRLGTRASCPRWRTGCPPSQGVLPGLFLGRQLFRVEGVVQ